MFPVPDTPVALDKALWSHTPATSIWAPGPRSTRSGGHMDPGPKLTEMLATRYAFMFVRVFRQVDDVMERKRVFFFFFFFLSGGRIYGQSTFS